MRVPVGQTFDSLRFALPGFGCAERYGSTLKKFPFVAVLLRLVGKLLENCTSAVPVIPCRKGV